MLKILPLIIGFLMDVLLGDPNWKCHPICLVGNLISLCEKKIRPMCKSNFQNILGGLLTAVIVIGVSGGITAVILKISYGINIYFGAVIEGIICWFMLAARSLYNESMRVYHSKTLEQGREAVARIVGRDTQALDEEGVIKAAVETVAENTSDGIIAPVFYIMLFGALGGVVYKAINTMDSMLGYKNEKYLYFGKIPARLDDLANLIPARLSAVFMIFASVIGGFDGKNALKIYLRDRYKHKSPNSANTEAVCAGALNIRLAGNAYYFGELYEKPYIGDDNRKIVKEDIKKANVLMWITSILGVVLAIIIRFLL